LFRQTFKNIAAFIGLLAMQKWFAAGGAEARCGANPTRCPQGHRHRLQLSPGRLAEPAVLKQGIHERYVIEIAGIPIVRTSGEISAFSSGIDHPQYQDRGSCL
jgi:hypothetical protein